MNREEIIKMIDYSSSKDVQNEGVRLALQEEDLDFVMYHSFNQIYADNCVKIFTSLPYDKCQRYFDDLFSWIEDLNRTGAQEILEYLSKAPAERIFKSFGVALEASIKRKSRSMMYGLLLILRENNQLEVLVKNNNKLAIYLSEIKKETL
ncbi:MAG: hypothetical protein IJ309_03750 [Clostridia bacterium]|nr:hypothetical protein [Clostridia bacterium]